MSTTKRLAELLRDSGAKLTFSQWCHSGIAHFVAPEHVCGCWRCREERGEPWTSATEDAARRDSIAARQRFSRRGDA